MSPQISKGERARGRVGDFLHRAMDGVCRSSQRRPWAWLLASALLLLPFAVQLPRLELDTNLVRLLPTRSPAAVWTERLAPVIGDGGYFLLLLEGPDRDVLVEAVESAALEVTAMESVRRIVYRNDTELFDEFGYGLVPSHWLERVSDQVLRLEARANPMTEDLLGGPAGGEEDAGSEAEAERLRREIDSYRNMTRYHESEDGTVFGLIIHPGLPVTDLSGMLSLHESLVAMADRLSAEHGIWAAIDGSQLTNLREYSIIREDLVRSGAVALICIVLVLGLCFRSALAIPFLLYPLLAGLVCAFGLVPALTGELNTITAFLLAVLFGLGIDSAIHLGGRFQLELSRHDPERALLETFRVTGPAVAVAGLTTALAFGVLGLSTMRGVKEFGIIAGLAILMVLLAMLLVMPASLAIGHRMGAFEPRPAVTRLALVPGRLTTLGGFTLLLAALIAAVVWMRFDYDFRRLRADIPEQREVSERWRKVYRGSLSPAALYLAPDLERLDALVGQLEERMATGESTFGRIGSVRDFAPSPEEMELRREWLEEIRDQLSGGWVRRISDPDWLELVLEFRDSEPIERFPGLEDLPEGLVQRVTASDGSGAFLLGIYPSGDRQHGRNAMAFTRELYTLESPEGVGGPVGDTPVMAEILWTATREGPILIGLSLGSLLLVLLLASRSLSRTLLMLTPLILAQVLALGVLAAFGFKLNFFNVFIIAALLGIGIDFSVHYFRRWEELGMDVATCQAEMLRPLVVCAVTTGSGFAALVIARHPGVHSIGVLAVAGIAATLFSTVVLYPALLDLIRRRRSRGGPATSDSLEEPGRGARAAAGGTRP